MGPEKKTAGTREGGSSLWKSVRFACAVIVGVLFALFAVIAVAPVVATWGIGWFAAALGMQGEAAVRDTFERFGQFGDSFGVVTSVATVIALALLIWTYRLQKKEFLGMREFMERQTAWNVVLQLCEQYREMVAQVTANPPGGWIHAPKPENTHGKNGLREVISHILASVETLFVGELMAETGSRNPKLDGILYVAEMAFSPHEGCFRLLHRIFKHIDGLKCSDEEKQQYARVPRSMLSNIELEALLINCLTKRGRGMKIYVERYAVFNNYAPVVLEDGMAREFCSNQNYEPRAFGDNLWKSDEGSPRAE